MNPYVKAGIAAGAGVVWLFARRSRKPSGDYGWWFSDPKKASEFDAILTDAFSTLRRRSSLTEEEAERVFGGIFRILRDEESEFEWDDAWDTLDHLRPRHAAAIPVLVNALFGKFSESLRDEYAKHYAIRALVKVDADGEQASEVLTKLLHGANPGLRKEAAEALKKLRRSRRW